MTIEIDTAIACFEQNRLSAAARNDSVTLKLYEGLSAMAEAIKQLEFDIRHIERDIKGLK